MQHKDVYQPWGTHCAIAEGDRFHVRLLTIKPKEKTATQLRFIPAKNLLVVTGIAIIHYDNKEIIVKEGEAVHVPIGVPCAIENPQDSILELIEVRCGDYAHSTNVTRVKEYNQNAKDKETNLL